MATINMLSDELLSAILQYLPHDGPQEAMPYLLVCKTWAAFIKRFLYIAVTISDSQGKYAVKPERFLEILHRTPEVSGYVQDIAFPMDVNEPECRQTVEEIVRLCAPFRKVALPSGKIEHVLPLVHRTAISELRSLEVYLLTLRQVIQSYSACSLDELRISHGMWDVEWYGQYVSPNEIDPLPPISDIVPGLQERTGTLRVLHCVRISGPAESLLKFLHWPAALHELRLTRMCDSESAESYDLDSVQAIFDVHKTTLRRARVGMMPSTSGRPSTAHSIIDVSTYEDLRRITVPHRGTFEQAPDFVAQRLHAPKLQHITFNFGSESDLETCDFEEFGKDQARWLEEFVVALAGHDESRVDTDKQETISLPDIHLEFNPVHSPREGPPGDDWPWDHINPLKEFALQKGIRITSKDYDENLSAPPIHFPFVILEPQFRLRRQHTNPGRKPSEDDFEAYA